MNIPFLERSQLLVGNDVMESINSKNVIIFGVGGVGSWCAESLIRSGIRYLTVVDYDKINISNINRQIMATHSTICQPKVEALKKRLLDINPDAQINAIPKFFNNKTKDEFHLEEYDYIIDCIDNLKDKILLAVEATKMIGVFFSSMGSALKLNFTNIHISEFWKVEGCPLAAAMRKRMRQYKLFPSKKYICVFSSEVLNNKGKPLFMEQDSNLPQKTQINGTMVHITAIFGFALAGLVIQDIVKQKKR